ncbi:MAG: flippase [Candidatus Omnitrophica bacterium]|nr:flippase [Candidatus Omnitrophota bacterium]
MLSKFNIDKKRLISNFFSLSSVEAANYLFPLITLPYLVRVLGPEKYGLINFAAAFIYYFVLLTDYGFNLSATREISINREDKRKVLSIFNSVMFVKFVLMVVSLIIMLAMVFSIPKFRQDWLIYIGTFGMVLGNVLFPIWLFQGMEKMKLVALLNLLAKFIFVIAIFIFVRKQSDYIYVPLITSLGFMTAGVISLVIAARRFGIIFRMPAGKDCTSSLKEGWHVFISTVSVSLYTSSNAFILGLFTNNTIVGYYSASERIIRSGQRLINPISQTLYPHISKLVADSKEKAAYFIKKVIVVFGGVGFAASILLFALAAPIVNIILGNQFEQSIIVLKILAFLPFMDALSNIFGIQTMLTFNMKEALSRIYISGGILSIILALILVPLWKHVGTAMAALITETYISLAMFAFIHKKGILYAKRQVRQH